jgi:hypothetical protein
VTIGGAARREEPVQFVVIPQQSAVAYAASGVWILENAAERASFIPGHWLEFLNKSNNRSLLGNTAAPVPSGTIEAKDGTLVFGGQRVVRMEDLDDAAQRRVTAPAVPVR